MWSLERLASLAVLLPSLLWLGGCGFHPLYGQASFDPQLREELAEIRVDPLFDRQGQLLRNALLTDLNPAGEPAKPRYHLAVALAVTESQQALQTDQTATRDVLYYNILFRLYEGSTAITAGTFHQVFSYDFLQEHYANVTAAADIQQRAATAISAEIRNRLAIYFAQAAKVRAADAKKAESGAAPAKEGAAEAGAAAGAPTP
jgi:LPS-assembly lipoprotein